MSYQINSLETLTECFRRLPGIGPKMAQRLSFHMLNMPEEQARGFADAITQARNLIHRCPICQNLTDKPVCSVCEDERRDKSVICVVESPSDVMAVEKTREYHGLYHVLYGLISPMDNIGPADLPLKELVTRLSSGEVKEVIV
ncbi:MAG: recombination mediator RecR, partial [Eubacteriales bacterium]